MIAPCLQWQIYAAGEAYKSMVDAFRLFVNAELIMEEDFAQFEVALATAWDAKEGNRFENIEIEIAKAQTYILPDSG